MKRFFTWVMCCILFITVLPLMGMGYMEEPKDSISVLPLQPAESLPPEVVQADGSILIETKSGKVLYQKNARQRMYPASTTKILTALLAIEYGDLDEKVEVGDEVKMIERDASKANLKKGERITLADLLRGLLLPSGNDAALTIAIHIARKKSGDKRLTITEALHYFADLMNTRARELGALDSHFVNPHGYHDVRHYTTPYDLALIAREAMKKPFFREVVSTPVFVMDMGVKGTSGKKIVREWANTNQLIQRKSKYYFPYSTGIKTGHTSKAGYCLVSASSHNGLDLIAVTLKDSQNGRWKDSRTLLDYGLTHFVWYPVVEKGKELTVLPVIGQLQEEPESLTLEASKGYTDLFAKEAVDKLQEQIIWDNRFIGPSTDAAKKFVLIPPISKGEKVGKAIFSLDGQVVAECDLLAAQDVQWANYFSPVGVAKEEEGQFTQWLRRNPAVLYTGAALILCIVLMIIFARFSASQKRRRRRRR